MIIVGLTGGIGSGKTTVAKIFKELGIPVFFADDAAKKLMQESATLRSKIRATFGDKSYLNNTLNRSYLANLVFTDKTNLERLNKLVHPAVKNYFKNWMSQQNAPYLIYENAILYEIGSDKDCDFVIAVSANHETRIKRVVKRDAVTRQDVLDRINNQWDAEKKVHLADAVIINDNNKALKSQVLEIEAEIKRKFNLD
jgi:dephospho-CoA kinase